MAYRTQEARLRDGARAIRVLSEPHPGSLDDLINRLDVVMAGALALQSLEDLGSTEANEQAWNDMLRLEKEGDALRKKIEWLKTQN